MASGAQDGKARRFSRRCAVRTGVCGAMTMAAALLAACGGGRDAAPVPTMPPMHTMPPVAASGGPPTRSTGYAAPPPAGVVAARATGAGVEVRIDNFTFAPKTLTISVGTEVAWVNHDDIPHTATSRDKLFVSPALDTDDRYAFRFTTPGTYPYFCAIHPVMTGQVIVQ